ncbi:hypothetical protein Tsp_13861 [Trichinella spiralis]|uniref:hypothetical protein n=1 Tax=Trichinella spiralis TaxID=6334 RepID=UPI0001EFDC7E|nr:hypothetical protein Tsp_13861 [Trichinella spiralis]
MLGMGRNLIQSRHFKKKSRFAKSPVQRSSRLVMISIAQSPVKQAPVLCDHRLTKQAPLCPQIHWFWFHRHTLSSTTTSRTLLVDAHITSSAGIRSRALCRTCTISILAVLPWMLKRKNHAYNMKLHFPLVF